MTDARDCQWHCKIDGHHLAAVRRETKHYHAAKGPTENTRREPRPCFNTSKRPTQVQSQSSRLYLGLRRLHEPLRPGELRAQLRRRRVPREHDGRDTVLVGEAGYVLAEIGRRAHRDVAHDPDHQQPQEAVQDPREAVLAEGLALWVLVAARKKGGRITRVRFGKRRTAPDGQTRRTTGQTWCCLRQRVHGVGMRLTLRETRETLATLYSTRTNRLQQTAHPSRC